MDFTTLPFEYEGRFGDQFRELGFTMEQAAWLEERDRQLEDFLAGMDTGGGGGTVSVLVASDDAPDATKERADFVCTGSGDQSTINEAIAALGDSVQGRIVLSEGAFDCDGAISLLPYGASILGMGYATIILTSYSSYALATSGGNTLRDFRLQGPEAGIGISSQGTEDLIERLEILDFDTGVGVVASNSIVTNSRITRVGSYALYFQSSPAYSHINGNHIDGLVSVEGAEHIILGNHFGSSGSVVVTSGGQSVCFASNYLPGGASDFTDSGTNTMRGTNFSSGGTW